MLHSFVIRATDSYGRDGRYNDAFAPFLGMGPRRVPVGRPDGRVAFSRIRTDLIDAANLCLAGRPCR